MTGDSILQDALCFLRIMKPFRPRLHKIYAYGDTLYPQNFKGFIILKKGGYTSALFSLNLVTGLCTPFADSKYLESLFNGTCHTFDEVPLEDQVYGHNRDNGN